MILPEKSVNEKKPTLLHINSHDPCVQTETFNLTDLNSIVDVVTKSEK